MTSENSMTSSLLFVTWYSETLHPQKSDDVGQQEHKTAVEVDRTR